MLILSKNALLTKLLLFIINIKVITYKDIDCIRLGLYTYSLKIMRTQNI